MEITTIRKYNIDTKALWNSFLETGLYDFIKDHWWNFSTGSATTSYLTGDEQKAIINKIYDSFADEFKK